MKVTVLVTLFCAAFPGLANAEDYGEYSARSPFAPYPSSFRTGEAFIVPPYGALPIRMYTTPQHGPFYNVPPYRVIAPY